MRLLIIDSHTIYRRGMAACLAVEADVERVTEAASVDEAVADPDIAYADVVLVDRDVRNLRHAIRRLRGETEAAIVVYGGRDDPDVLDAVSAGAVGYLAKPDLTAESLSGAVRAAATGAGVLAPELLGRLLRSIERVSTEVLEPRGIVLALVTPREREVLRLVAQGHPTREVARRLNYSERTIKNVLHDVATKLGARSRSQAVAHAVREGII